MVRVFYNESTTSNLNKDNELNSRTVGLTFPFPTLCAINIYKKINFLSELKSPTSESQIF